MPLVYFAGGLGALIINIILHRLKGHTIKNSVHRSLGQLMKV